jgi:superfamily II RNA helicase
MASVTGRKSVLIEAGGRRPVPLRYYFCTKRDFAPLFKDEEAGPGALRGLLGLRGDGSAVGGKKKKKKGFDNKAMSEYVNERGMPEGLGLNPVLQMAAEKRLAGIDRRIQRLVQEQQTYEYDSYKSSKYDYNSRKDYNSKTNGATMSLKEQRRMKESLLKSELRKSVPSISTLVKRLRQNELLPAIFFIFSRKGCDNAAEMLCESFKYEKDEDSNKRKDKEVRRSFKKLKGKGRGRGRRQQVMTDDWDLNDEDLAMVQDDDGRNFRADLLDQLLSDEFDTAFGNPLFTSDEDNSLLSEKNLQYYSEIGLLNYNQVREVASRVLAFNDGNPEIAFEDSKVDQLLCGVGSHHAGILPAHKAFVETLFRLELMKAVFATETLAAGINMPARTTVICAMAKRGDLGMELLETANMLQMAGRAGRRGMDIEGACVVSQFVVLCIQLILLICSDKYIFMLDCIYSL